MTDELENNKLEQLLRRCAAHDEAALQALYKCVASQLLAVLIRMLRTRSAAEDALQDTFIRIWQHSKQFDQFKGRAMAWMVSIARNRAIDMMRANRPTLMLDAAELANAEQLHVPGPADRAEFGHTRTALERCLKLLAAKQRQCFVLAYQYGLTQDSIAATVAEPLGTVKSWLRRGLLSLKQCIES
jgi:RNA polymerase sigma-70 factor, ECF subfamily